MKCINKKVLSILLSICLVALNIYGCSLNNDELSDRFRVYSSANYNMSENASGVSYFAGDLCVSDNINYGLDKTDSQVALGAGVFNLTQQEVTYSQNIYDTLYPASLTKILTAYIIIKYCDLDDTVIVSANAVDQSSDSSVCGLNEGDQITVRALLYGLLLRSGNDAAVALAEYYATSVEAFAVVMNQEALLLGATGSHFVNPHGMPDEEHYTTVYDLYLFLNAAIQQEEFVKIINTSSICISYKDRNDKLVEKEYKNTNKYLNGDRKSPKGITVIGGKTGTTNAAGYCLALYSVNESGDQIISIVLKADGRSNLYLLMDQILSKFNNT